MSLKCEPLCQFGDRLFFTTFLKPVPTPQSLNKSSPDPSRRPKIRQRARGAPGLATDNDSPYYWFTIDDQLLYLSFFQDWGPLNLAMVYKACILIHELLEDAELSQHRLVLYSSDDPRRKANAALLMALYVMIVQRRAPWEAFHPIAEVEFMPFRDAGRGPSDFNLNIQDCLWGLWKAMQNGLCDMNEFNIEDYEYYEKVENGDWNWITPNFIAFASPVDTAWIKSQKEVKDAPPSSRVSTSSATSNSNLALQRKLPTPYLNCLDYFEKRNIRLVVRLNTELYDRNTFLDRGIDHMELYFDDGTNPTDEIVRTFLDVSDRVVEAGGVIAVHCKAGLGRTGTLIGAYLIWKYGFTANEAIAFMRIVRPGSVVGPQQQYMYLKQLEWSKWAAVDEIRRSQQLADAQRADTKVAATDTTPIVTPATPPAEDDENMAIDATPPASPVRPVVPAVPPVTPSRHVAAAAAKAKAIETPGQPRKTPNSKRVARDDSSDEENGEEDDILPALNTAPMRPKKPIRAATTKDGSATEQRPSRVTRSTAGAAAIRKAGTSAAASSSKSGQGPNKIPRLATTKTARAAAAVTAAAKTAVKPAPKQMSTKSKPNPPPPTPSRLPTLTTTPAASKASNASTLKEVASAVATKGKRPACTAATSADKNKWMTANPKAVVNVPASKMGSSERPGLRPVRRRRSSFSSADVVA